MDKCSNVLEIRKMHITIADTQILSQSLAGGRGSWWNVAWPKGPETHTQGLVLSHPLNPIPPTLSLSQLTRATASWVCPSMVTENAFLKHLISVEFS